jgi:hypothetical protein
LTLLLVRLRLLVGFLHLVGLVVIEMMIAQNIVGISDDCQVLVVIQRLLSIESVKQ